MKSCISDNAEESDEVILNELENNEVLSSISSIHKK